MGPLFPFHTMILTLLNSVYAWTAGWLAVILGAAACISFYTYVVPFIIQSFLPEQDLKTKYDAEWALVTGASSGIGRALTEKLAAQGLSVVMVALDDALLDEFYLSMSSAYKDSGVSFRKVGVNLGKPGYLQEIADATADIPVQLVFNNAGFVITGLYADVALPAQLANFECNSAAPVKITHLFLNRMLNAGLPGSRSPPRRNRRPCRPPLPRRHPLLLGKHPRPRRHARLPKDRIPAHNHRLLLLQVSRPLPRPRPGLLFHLPQDAPQGL